MIIKQIFKQDKLAVLSALLIFILMKPYFFWANIAQNYYAITVLHIILGLCFLRNLKFTNKISIGYLVWFLGVIILNVLVRKQNLNVFISLLPLVFLPFSKKDFADKVYQSFLDILTVIFSLSLVSYFGALLGFLHPISIIPPLNSIKSFYYYVYPFLVTDSPVLLRFFSVFDEPGVVGTICGIILCIQRFNLKDKRSIVILVAGLCSLSLFFIILVTVYFLLYYIFVTRSIKKLLVILLCIGAAIILIKSSPILNEVLGERLIYDTSTRTLQGDNRYGDVTKDVLLNIIGTKEFWFGIENKTLFLEMVQGTSSILNTIVLNGMLFFLAFSLFYISYGWATRHTLFSFFLFVFVFLAHIYQRPDTFHPESIFLWTYLARNSRYS